MSNEANTATDTTMPETQVTVDAPYGFKKDGSPRGKPGRPAGSKINRTAEKPLIRTENAPFGVKKDGTAMKRRGRPAGVKNGTRRARIEAAKAVVPTTAAPYGFRKSDGMPAKKRGRPSRADKIRAQFLSRQVFPTPPVAEIAALVANPVVQVLPEGQADRAAEILDKALEVLETPVESTENAVFPTHSPLLDAVSDDNAQLLLALLANDSDAYRMLVPPNPSPRDQITVGTRVEVVTDYGICRAIRRGRILRLTDSFAAIDCDDVGHQYHAIGCLRVIDE